MYKRRSKIYHSRGFRDGRQPVQLNRRRIARAANLPLDWQARREMLGFA